eukprot:m.293341 g.293341  ORF g.293341 m.293341 type:complete len:140 (-) comp20584_c0_seq1:325-744(-)
MPDGIQCAPTQAGAKKRKNVHGIQLFAHERTGRLKRVSLPHHFYSLINLQCTMSFGELHVAWVGPFALQSPYHRLQIVLGGDSDGTRGCFSLSAPGFRIPKYSNTPKPKSRSLPNPQLVQLHSHELYRFVPAFVAFDYE